MMDVALSQLTSAMVRSTSAAAFKIEILSARIEALAARIVLARKEDKKARNLTSLPGIGSIMAVTVRLRSRIPETFCTERTLRWCGREGSLCRVWASAVADVKRSVTRYESR